jgi:AcrR family transcriptional regulator
MNDTAARLRYSARKLFADKGFDGTSIREITRDARANLGAVTYHFGSKQALYASVLEHVFADLARRTEAAAAAPGTPEARLRGIVAAFFDFFADAPDAPRLVIREIASGAAPAPAVPLMRRNLAAIRTVIRDGIDSGRFRPIEPFLAAFSIISQSVWFAVMGPQIQNLAGVTLPANLPDAVERHVADIVCRALEPGEVR